ncbi:MAG: M12 family metallopeptidase, partial [Saprospiraceae bacterium]
MQHAFRTFFLLFLIPLTGLATGPVCSGRAGAGMAACLDTIPLEAPVPKDFKVSSKAEGRREKVLLRFPGDDTPRQVTLEIRDGKVFWNGDIVLFREETYEQLKLEKGNMISYTSYRWPNGVIPYTIEPGHSSVSQINNAINHVNANSNICMVPRTSETNYVEFVDNEPACWSYIGMIGGRQEINVDACGVGATIHEICHAAGMWHEQSRNDRDTYVTILFDNIEAGKEGNFEIGGTGITSVGAYDYASIMHYGTHYFTKNGSPTIQVKSPPAPAGTTIGQRSTLSSGDIASLNTMYTTRNCGGAAFLAVSPTSLSVGNTAQSQTFSVTSNIDWTVTESLSWVTVSPASGSNNGVVTVSFTENTTTSSRSGTITVSGSGVSSQTISLSQSGTPVPCSVPANLSLLGKDYSWFAAGWNTVAGATAYSWRYKRTADASWVTNDAWSGTNVLSAVRPPCTPHVFQVRAVCGSSFSDWSPELSFSTDGCGDPYCYSYGIAFGDWIKRVDFSNISGASEADYGYANYTSTVAAVNKGQSYPITLLSGNNSNSQGSTYYWSVWIDFNQDNDFNDAGENVLAQSASKSTSAGTGFSGTIAIPASAASGVTRMRVALSLNAGESPCATSSNYRDVEDYGINISAPAPALAVSPASLSFVAAGETKAASITSNVAWTVSESLGWISVTPASGSNNGTINVQADQNTSTSARNGTVSISGAGVAAQTITVNQSGAAAFLTATPTTLNFVSGGGAQNVSISSNISWTASESLSWLTLSSGSGSGNGTLTLTAEANTANSVRSGTVTLSGTGVPSVTITVNQSGAAAF